VDDAVLGRLPRVCVEDGGGTNDTLSFTQDVGGSAGMGVAWLLVLAGPLGWLGLFVVSAMRRGEMLTVTVPYSEAAYVRRATFQRSRRRAGALAAGVLILAVGSLSLGSTDGRLMAAALGAVAVGAFVSMVLASIRVNRLTVRLQLDASRRWVTMSRVHPNFADAVHYDGHSSPVFTSP
jgi:outer membrane lipoprotein SlyB